MNKVRMIQVELTSNCQASCPACLHTKGHIPKNLNLDPHVFKRCIDDIKDTLEVFSLEGNYGDSLMHPQALELLNYVVDHTTAFVQINTNGSYHPITFWSELGNLLSQTDHLLIFGIDGIDQDTHTRYRVGTDFNKILTNAKAFIDAGGKAEWKMIPFDYNADLEAPAKALADSLGFVSFVRNKTSRYWERAVERAIYNKWRSDNVIASDRLDESRVPPEPEDAQLFATLSQAVLDNIQVSLKGLTWESALKAVHANSPIKCQWGEAHKYQLSHDGTVYQCCHLEARYDRYESNRDTLNWNRYYMSPAVYEEDWNSIVNTSINDVINHEFFTTDLLTSHSNSTDSVVNPKLQVCVDRCSIIGNLRFDNV